MEGVKIIELGRARDFMIGCMQYNGEWYGSGKIKGYGKRSTLTSLVLLNTRSWSGRRIGEKFRTGLLDNANETFRFWT